MLPSHHPHTHALWLKLNKFAPSPQPHVDGHLCVLFTLILPFYFLLYLPPLIFFFLYLKSVVNLHNSANESMDSTDEFSLSTLARGHPLRTWIMTQRLKSHQRTYRISPDHRCSALEPEETRCGNTKRNAKTFKKVFNLTKLATTLVFRIRRVSRTILCYHSRRSFGRMWSNKLMSIFYVSSK